MAKMGVKSIGHKRIIIRGLEVLRAESSTSGDPHSSPSVETPQEAKDVGPAVTDDGADSPGKSSIPAGSEGNEQAVEERSSVEVDATTAGMKKPENNDGNDDGAETANPTRVASNEAVTLSTNVIASGASADASDPAVRMVEVAPGVFVPEDAEHQHDASSEADAVSLDETNQGAESEPRAPPSEALQAARAAAKSSLQKFVSSGTTVTPTAAPADISDAPALSIEEKRAIAYADHSEDEWGKGKSKIWKALNPRPLGYAGAAVASASAISGSCVLARRVFNPRLYNRAMLHGVSKTICGTRGGPLTRVSALSPSSAAASASKTSTPADNLDDDENDGVTGEEDDSDENDEDVRIEEDEEDDVVDMSRLPSFGSKLTYS